MPDAPANPPKLTAIDGDRDAPRPHRRRALGDPEQVTCWRCRAENGVESSAVVRVTLAPMRGPDGRKAGGKPVWACAYCLAQGLVTVLIRG